MQTSAPTLRKLLLPLVVVLVAVLITVVIWRSFGGAVPGEGKGYRVTVQIPQAESMFANTSVRTAGVTVGSIVKVTRRGAHADVEFELDPEFAPLRQGARVMARTKSLLGEAYLEVAPGDAATAPVPDGGRLATAQARPTQRLDDVLATFDPRTRREFRALFAGTAEAFDGRAGDVNAALGEARPLAADLEAVTDTLDAQRPALRGIVADGSQVLQALGRKDQAVQAAITQTERVLDTTAARNRDLRRTIEALPPFLGSLRRATASIETSVPDLRAAVSSVRGVTPGIEPALRTIIARTPTFRQLFRRLPSVIAAGNQAAPALTRILDTTAPALDPIWLAARQLIPVFRLAAVSGPDIIGTLGNVGSMTNGATSMPGGQKGGYVAGWLSAWNEIIGGWTKKLPTNRQNPYPAPGSQGDIAGGGLKAYDCRNTGNPLIVPAIGTGVPDCVTQEPWSFNGRTAAYPRLLLDPP